jgi:hypothetical protein
LLHSIVLFEPPAGAHPIADGHAAQQSAVGADQPQGSTVILQMDPNLCVIPGRVGIAAKNSSHGELAAEKVRNSITVAVTEGLPGGGWKIFCCPGRSGIYTQRKDGGKNADRAFLEKATSYTTAGSLHALI